jgi:hypothetical protein
MLRFIAAHHKSESQCKDILQIALETCISYKKHLRLVDMPSHFRRMMQYNLTRALQKHLKENSNCQNNLTVVPDRTKWHQQTCQRLPDKEQTYSLRLSECQSKQMDILEWLAEGKDIEINLAKTTRTVIWPLELEGVRRMENTLEH